jgi:hypothetical protein
MSSTFRIEIKMLNRLYEFVGKNNFIFGIVGMLAYMTKSVTLFNHRNHYILFIFQRMLDSRFNVLVEEKLSPQENCS